MLNHPSSHISSMLNIPNKFKQPSILKLSEPIITFLKHEILEAVALIHLQTGYFATFPIQL